VGESFRLSLPPAQHLAVTVGVPSEIEEGEIQPSISPNTRVGAHGVRRPGPRPVGEGRDVVLARDDDDASSTISDSSSNSGTHRYRWVDMCVCVCVCVCAVCRHACVFGLGVGVGVGGAKGKIAVKHV
jgi:hypothetical protein